MILAATLTLVNIRLQRSLSPLATVPKYAESRTQRPPPLYLLQLLPQHLVYATKSQILLNHPILPTQNALIIGEQPNPRKACNETAAPLRTGTQQATKLIKS